MYRINPIALNYPAKLIILKIKFLIIMDNYKQHFSKIEGNNISYIDSGFGDTSILFLHGAFIDKTYWQEQVSFFEDKYRTIAIDLPGHGSSTFKKELLSIKKFANIIIKFIQELELRNVILVGHSFACDMVLEITNDKHIDPIGIICLDYFKNIHTPIPHETITYIEQSMKKDFAKTNENYVKQFLVTPNTPEPITKRVLSSFKNINPEVGIPLNIDFFHYNKREKELLNSLQKTLYLVNADYSPTDELALRKELNTSNDFYQIQCSCHYPMLETPAELNKTLSIIFEKILHRPY